MQICRRELLDAATWSVAASVTSATASGPLHAEPKVTGQSALTDWSAVQRQFDLSPEWLHFSQFFIVSHPAPVREAIERYRRQIDAMPFDTIEYGVFGDGNVNRLLAVQKAAAAYTGGKPEDIALVDSTTVGLALGYHGLRLKPQDEILATMHDHHVHHEVIRTAVVKAGASTRRVALYDDPVNADPGQMAERLRKAIGRNTRVVGLTWVHSSTGAKLPVKLLSAVVAEANARRGSADRILLVLDGVHGFGNQAERIAELGADFVCAGTHKWIFAPRGTGIIWGRPEAWKQLVPIVPSFHSLDAEVAWQDDRPPPPTHAAMVSTGGFKAYEHQWAMVEAFQFHERIGPERVADRIAALNSRLKDGMAAMPHVVLHTPRDAALSAGITCFDIKGMKPTDVVAKLRERRVVASTSPYKVSVARLAPSLVNDEAQVDAALDALAKLG